VTHGDVISSAARRTFVASFLGWTLDAFDFLILTFVITRVAADFRQSVAAVAVAITLTLGLRPVGALIFGRIADRYGRRTPLMIDIGLYSVLELLTALAPNFASFLLLRALFGIAMGGEWGLGAALTMEALPPKKRGLYSGLLQQGYMVGYLLAAVAFFAVAHVAPAAGLAKYDWRILFAIGALPALLILYIRAKVPESPAWLARSANAASSSKGAFKPVLVHLPLFVYATLLMASMNAMSHGTQDLYATFLQKQHGFSPGVTSALSIVAAIGAIAGGVTFGAISQRAGRRAMLMTCAVLGAALIPLWAFSATVALLSTGAFAIQFMVQGAWGVIPAHLNELSPPGARGTFPGLTYQLGNLVSAGIPQLEASLAQQRFVLPDGRADYGHAMAAVSLGIFAAVFVFAALGFAIKPENRRGAFAPEAASP
jgi:MFS transporter, SHS family, lactate transporter